MTPGGKSSTGWLKSDPKERWVRGREVMCAYLLVEEASECDGRKDGKI